MSCHQHTAQEISDRVESLHKVMIRYVIHILLRL